MNPNPPQPIKTTHKPKMKSSRPKRTKPIDSTAMDIKIGIYLKKQSY